ncbi:MAG: 5-(carboxyamino)imidazole ribonucleotide synthase [Pseudomonadota bacterium]
MAEAEGDAQPVPPASATAPLEPGATIGILGAGQLGRMLSLAAAQLGFNVHVFNDTPGGACPVSGASTIAAWDARDALIRFASACDVVTYEFENIPAEVARTVADHVPLRPGIRSLEISQDRIAEKKFLTSQAIPVAPYAVVTASDGADAPSAVDVPGTPPQRPFLLKTARLGYDGKGQIPLDAGADLSAAHRELAGVPAVLEERIAFEREISVIAVGGIDGSVLAYDPAENTHANQILHRSIVPANVSAETAREAVAIASRIVQALDHVGTIGVEFFHCPENEGGDLLVNEIAPRVHNSGHWTLDACLCSQFENHIRAIAGWPLGSCDRHSDAEMSNLLGDEIDAWKTSISHPSIALHHYAKGEARPGRKMGHITRIGERRVR